MSFAETAARTLKRLMVGGKATEGPTWIPRLWLGLSKEFERENDYTKLVQRSTVPSDNTPVEALDDLESKYGVSIFPGSTPEERLSRIKQRASTAGHGGPAWLEGQVQTAGYTLYLHRHADHAGDTIAIPMGTADGDIMETEEDEDMIVLPYPSYFPGILIVSSPAARATGTPEYGQIFSSALYTADGDAMVTADGEDMNTLVVFSYPFPEAFVVPIDDLTAWNRVLYLSPYADRLAALESELLEVTVNEYRFLRKLIIQNKYLRDWCIAQVKVV
jgi:hypothetical protein